MERVDNFGLKIKLKKVNPNYRVKDNSFEEKSYQIANEFIALGHYDAIEIEKVDELSDFRPGKEMEQKETESFSCDLCNAKYYTEYTLKLLTIENDIYSEEYKHWSNGEGVDLPFIAIISVDIKDRYLKCKQESETIPNYVDTIKEICGEKAAELNVKIAPYFCLGYTDFVILVRSNSLKEIQRCIEEVRNNGKVSSTYTVFGLKQNQNFDNISKADKLSVKFEWSFKDIAPNLDEIQFFNKLKKTGVKFLNTCGVFDNFAYGEIGENELYELFSCSNPYFDKEDVPYGKVKNFNTYINFSESKTCKSKVDSPSKREDKVLKTLQVFLKKYKLLIDKTNSHKRLYKAMKEMGRYYGHISFTYHSFDVQKVFGGFYTDFLRSLTFIINYLLDNLEKENLSINDKIQNLDLIIEKFRNLFGTLLFDILRSDHSFFEAPSIAHPSIGSTTKLLLAYNNIVNNWNENVKTAQGHHGVSFLVTSGGCDKTEAHNLLYEFEELIPVKKNSKSNADANYKLPVIITISEASLYDIEGTLFRLAHEFFHLKGDRNRKERFSGFYKGLFYEYIDYCCHYIAQESKLTKDKSDGEQEHNTAEITISAKDFLEEFEAFCVPESGTQYNMLHEFLDELDNANFIEEKSLKNYEELTREAFSNLLFIPAPAFGNFYAASQVASSYDDIYKSFEDNFTVKSENQRYFKTIDANNDWLIQLLADIIKNTKDKKDICARIDKILKFVPNNCDKYVKNTATYIPQIIGELSDIYARIEYKKNDKISKNNKSRYGLIYDYYHNGKDYYNQKGFREYSSGCGGGIEMLPPQAEFYARLWIRATIAFFQDGSNAQQIGHVPYNLAGYEDMLWILYKECFADACALNSFKAIYKNTDDLVALYLSAFLFERRDLNVFFEMVSNDTNMRIQIPLALRMAVVIAGITNAGDGEKINLDVIKVTDKIWERVREVFIKNQQEYKFKQDMKKALTSILDWYNGREAENELSGFKNHIYIRELLSYVRNRLNDNNRNKLPYPRFNTNNDYDNAHLILKLWINSYWTGENK